MRGQSERATEQQGEGVKEEETSADGEAKQRQRIRSRMSGKEQRKGVCSKKSAQGQLRR